MQLEELLLTLEHNNASDLHISPNNPPIIRIDGDLTRISGVPLSQEVVANMIRNAMNDEQRQQFEDGNEVDFAFMTQSKQRFRVNAFMNIHGESAVFRIIPKQPLNFNAIKAPTVLKSISELPKGLILVTGTTGSGKSTTVSAMINYINENHKKHIITIEDPIECIYTPKESLISQREVGSNTKSFAAALRAALREDPDVIMVGEMRDLETIQMTLTAAETGHLVISTMHTSSATHAMSRIIDVFPEGSKDMIRGMLSSSFEAIISQKLIKRKDGKGRVGAYEILLGTSAARNLIRESEFEQLYSVMQTGTKLGMQTMEKCVTDLLEKDLITNEEAQKIITNLNKDIMNKNSKPGALQESYDDEQF